MKKEELIITIIVAILSSSFLNGIITHFLYNSKLKKDQKMKVKDEIWKKVDLALEEIREIELKAKAKEIYDFESTLFTNGYTNFQDGVAVYPEIMSDFKTFHNFFVEVNEARGKWSKYLDPECGAYLYCMQNYCMNLMEYLAKNNLSEQYSLAGCVFFADILNWQKEYEKLIVKRLNKSKYKLYSEEGKRWQKAKAKVNKKIWEKSILYNLINNSENEELLMVKSFLEHYIQPRD